MSASSVRWRSHHRRPARRPAASPAVRDALLSRFRDTVLDKISRARSHRSTDCGKRDGSIRLHQIRLRRRRRPSRRLPSLSWRDRRDRRRTRRHPAPALLRGRPRGSAGVEHHLHDQQRARRTGDRPRDAVDRPLGADARLQRLPHRLRRDDDRLAGALHHRHAAGDVAHRPGAESGRRLLAADQPAHRRRPGLDLLATSSCRCRRCRRSASTTSAAPTPGSPRRWSSVACAPGSISARTSPAATSRSTTSPSAACSSRATPATSSLAASAPR